MARDPAGIGLGKRLIGAGAVALLVASVLPWYRVDGRLGEYARIGWGRPAASLAAAAFVLSAVMLAGVVLERAGALTERPSGSVAYCVGSLAVLACVLGKWITEPDGAAFDMYVAIGAAAVVALGGVLTALAGRGLPQVHPRLPSSARR